MIEAPRDSDHSRRFDLIPPGRKPRFSLAERLTIAGAVALLAGSVAALVGGQVDDGPEPARSGGADAPAPAVPPVAPVLIAQQDPSGRASAITVLVPAATGRGGTVVFVPPGTMTEVASLGLEPVGRSLELGGASRLQGAVENLLGAGVGGVAVVDDAGLAALLGPAGALTVAVPEPVEQVAEGGRVEVLFPAGPTPVRPVDASRFLAARGRASDLSRLARHQAFWDAWLAALRRQPEAVPTQPLEVGRALAALAAGPVRSRVLPVEGFGSTDEDGELYKVRDAELRRLVAAVFPGTGRVAGDRPRVQILNGTGAVGLAEAVRSRLGPGYDVRFTGNAASFGKERTEVVFYRRSQQDVAQRLRDALGVGELVLSRRSLDVVDVTVVVGKDFGPE